MFENNYSEAEKAIGKAVQSIENELEAKNEKRMQEILTELKTIHELDPQDGTYELLCLQVLAALQQYSCLKGLEADC